MSGNNLDLQQAKVLVNQAYRAQMQGKLGDAIGLYQRSIDMHPTAEAHTYLGWTFSMMKRYDEAIEQCHEAIMLDPEFGNPYNDIGSYLIEKGEFVEAIPWLMKATTALRYDSPQYPLMNLGRIYSQLGQISKAIDYFNQALAIDPLYHPARWAKYGLIAKYN